MDIIANTLTKVRNALTRKLAKVDVVKSGMVENILKVMKREGYIVDFKDSEANGFSYTVTLKYVQGKPAIQGLQRVSRLSLRVYSNAEKIPMVMNNYGVAVISTSKGVLTDKEAKALNVGGEVICTIW